jgi:CO/xanthine dehydrogenase Mo-binding subunit
MTPITCAKPSKFPSARVIYRFLPVMPVRVSALCSLGAYMNVFAIESFMDELAGTAGEDPVAFRLKHLDDPRAREVVSKVADEFGWRQEGAQPGRCVETSSPETISSARTKSGRSTTARAMPTR